MKPKNVDEYIASVPKEAQSKLKEIRAIIKKVVPKVEERISYGIAGLNLNNRFFLYFAGYKKHVSLYPFTSEMEKIMKESSKYKTSGKGTIQFPLDKALPKALIQKIVKFRVKENLKRKKNV